MPPSHRTRASVWLLCSLGGLALLGGLVHLVLPPAIERSSQGVTPHEPYDNDERGRALHSALTIVDWHADSLLWDRDLLEESSRGHVDVPRLERGNVAVQMFTAVTKTPRGQNYDRNTAATDNVTALAVFQLWPLRTWGSLYERARYQADKLHRASERAPDRLRVAHTREDLAALLALRADGGGPVIGLLGVEGAHALEGRLENVDGLYAAGFRMIGLHHFFDNALGGSLHGESREGLTSFGRDVVRRLDARGLIIDVAHSSPAVVDDVLGLAARPVVVSHTGLHGVCPSPRNLSDEQMRRIVDAGGLVAVGYWAGAVCDVSPAGVARAIAYAVDLLGEDHVALGSDFDGATTTSFDASELAVLTAELLGAGLLPSQVEKVMGGNSVRFLLDHLPPRVAD